MNERDTVAMVIGLIGLIKRPHGEEPHGSSLTLGEMGFVEKAEAFVFKSEESCKWCGGKTVVMDGSKCPVCEGTGLRNLNGGCI